MLQVLKQASLETFVRNVAKEDARPLQPGQSQPQWKTSAPQSIVITITIAEMILRDGRHPYMVEGEGLKRLLKILEPQYVLSLFYPGSRYVIPVFGVFAHSFPSFPDRYPRAIFSCEGQAEGAAT